MTSLSFLRLITPAIDHNGDACVRFDYHMNGDDIGKLTGFIWRDGEAVGDAFFEKEGEQADEWKRAEEEMRLRTDDQVGDDEFSH